MGTATQGGKGFKERARVSGERPGGAASCRQQYSQASCQTPPYPHMANHIDFRWPVREVRAPSNAPSTWPWLS